MSDEFERVRAAFGGRPGVDGRRMFGADGLSVGGHFFAMAHHGALVVKLPAPRVAQLVAEGLAVNWGPSPGRVMKEWASLVPGAVADPLPLAEEALAFVASR